MKLKVGRFKSKNGVTIGELWLNDKFFCYTLEDEIRPIMSKIYGSTAIAQGIYNLVLSFSNKFQKYMPEVLNVKNFKGIRIHSGNTIADTLGCLIVGTKTDGKSVSESKLAYDKLLFEIKEVEQKEKITIEYINLNKDYNNV